MDNAALLEKAVITTDALAAAGKLNDEQANKFIDYVVDETVWKNNARIVRPKAENWEIDKIGVGKRLAMPAEEAKDPGTRRGVTTSKVVLTPKEIMVPFEIGDTFKEINIEGGDVEDHIIKLMAKATANDLEELYINGDVNGAAALEGDLIEGGSATLFIKDTYLGMFNGWARRADSGTVSNAAGANIGAATFSAAIRSMPTKFRRDRAKLRWLLSPDLAQLWRERISTRATAMGDEALTKGGTFSAFGIPIVEVPFMHFQPRIVEHVTLVNATTPATLRYAPIANEVVVLATLGAIPTAKFIKDTDYTVDLAAGTITKVGAAIPDGSLVKVTYDANPQILLSHFENFIVAIGRDIRIEKDRDIFRRVNQYAISLRASVAEEEVTALVKVKNIGLGV